MKTIIIKSIKDTEVIVPAKHGSLNSGTVIDKNASFAKKNLIGESWKDFANQSKWIIRVEKGIMLWLEDLILQADVQGFKFFKRELLYSLLINLKPYNI